LNRAFQPGADGTKTYQCAPVSKLRYFLMAALLPFFQISGSQLTNSVTTHVSCTRSPYRLELLIHAKGSSLAAVAAA